MGFTRYWTLNLQGSEKNYKKALTDIRKIVKAKTNILAGGHGEGKPNLKGNICFNGIGPDQDHETFLLCKILSDSPDSFNFCKTAQKPYDVVVSACLVVLAHYMGEDVKVSVDGDQEDWVEGVKLANKVLKKKFPNPLDPTSVRFIKESACLNKQT